MSNPTTAAAIPIDVTDPASAVAAHATSRCTMPETTSPPHARPPVNPYLSPPPSDDYRINFGNGTATDIIQGRDKAERAMQEQ